MKLAVGETFAGDFRILGKLAEGGMSCLYAVEQHSTKRRRALKLMRADLARDEASRRRFLREARIGAAIESEHVVDVVAAGIDVESGIPWLAMELLSGQDLGTFVARHGPMSAASVVTVFRQLCHALDRAHAAGVVHRDLKPENVYLAHSRRSDVELTVKVLDFGISKWMHERTSATTEPIGTPFWMAPEQLEPEARVTVATDIWALGLLAFFALSGKQYWRAANTDERALGHAVREMLFAPLERPRARTAQLGGAPSPAGFDEWFLRCVARDPRARFQTASAALTALEDVLAAPASTSARTVGPTALMDMRDLLEVARSSMAATAGASPERPRRASRRPFLALVGASVVSLCALGTAVLSPRESEEPTPADAHLGDSPSRPVDAGGARAETLPDTSPAPDTSRADMSAARDSRARCDAVDWRPLRRWWTRLYHRGTDYPHYGADVQRELRWQSSDSPVVRLYVRARDAGSPLLRSTTMELYAEWGAAPQVVMSYPYIETGLRGDEQDLVAYVGERTDERLLVSMEVLPQRDREHPLPGRSRRVVAQWSPEDGRLARCGDSYDGPTRGVPRHLTIRPWGLGRGADDGVGGSL